MLTCRLEGSWLEIFDRHYLIPLVRSWNSLQQKLYCALYLCLHGWRGLAEQSQAVADDLGAAWMLKSPFGWIGWNDGGTV